jgi:hypothetical protein
MRGERPLVLDRDPAGAVLGLARPAVEADDLRAAQAAGKTDEQDGAVAQAAEIMAQRRQHGEKILGQHCLLLLRRAAMTSAMCRSPRSSF